MSKFKSFQGILLVLFKIQTIFQGLEMTPEWIVQNLIIFLRMIFLKGYLLINIFEQCEY